MLSFLRSLLHPGGCRVAAPLQLLLLAAALVPMASPAHAQTDPNLHRGFAPDKAFAVGDVDSVNLFNGNLTLSIPVGGTYSDDGGLAYGLLLTHNSNVWDFETTWYSVNGQQVSYRRADPGEDFNAGLGFTLSLGKLHSGGSSTAWRYVGADAAEHVFYGTLHVGETVTSNVFYTRDGSYLRLKTSSFESGSGLPLVAEVEFPDGRIHRFTRAVGTAPFRLAAIKDRFANQVSVTYPTPVAPVTEKWQISDGYRTHTVELKTRSNGTVVVDNVKLAAFGATTATYTFAYTDATISRSCLDDDPESLGGSPATAAVSLLASVTAPDGSRYVFNTYNTTCFDGTTEIKNLPGTLAKLTLPTLGQLEWTYQTYSLPVRGGGCGQSGPGVNIHSPTGVKTKRMLNASGTCETWEGVGCQWTYTPEKVSGQRKTTVLLPNGDKAVHFFNDGISLSTTTWTGWQYGLPIDNTVTDGAGRYLSQEIWDGATKLRSTYVRYEHDRLPTSTCNPDQWYNTNRRPASEKTVYHDDAGRYAETTRSGFDGFGHYRQTTTSGNYGAGDVRSSLADFNPERGTYAVDPATNVQQAGHTAWPTARNWVLGTVQSTSVTEGSQTAKADFCYAGENTNTMTGQLLRKRVMKGAAAGANDLVTSFTHAGGNLTEERSYGGDKQALATTADLCALALSGDQYQVRHTYAYGSRATSRWYTASGTALAGGLILDQTIDASTGLPSAVRDVAGVQVNLTYDSHGRLTWEKPTTGNGAWTEYRWNKAASATSMANVQIFERPNGSTSVALAQSRVYFDPHGRVWRDQVLGANGVWSTVDTVWNSLGWKRSTTERQPIAPTRWTIYKDFDPFGRPKTIVPPDGDDHKITLTYAGTRTLNRTVRVNNGTSRINAVTTERYDRQGRLWQVVEPSGSGGANVTTTYGYDVGNRLVSVATSGQSRNFSYDNRGFLNWERHPEKGPTGNGYVRHLGYDALGNPGQTLDAATTSGGTTGVFSNLTFTYDRASRLTQVRETGGNVLKAFTYGAANSGSSKQQGKVVTADRYNYLLIGTTPYTVQVRETYTYAGVAGAVSARDTQTWVGASAVESFTQAWTWNDLGDAASVTYPRCTYSACNGTSVNTRTISFGYTNGFLTSVPNYASVSYHPNGTAYQVTHTNDVTWTQAADPNGMGRPASIATTGAATNWTTGTYAYDGTGSITAIGTSTYLYDAVSRLTTASVKNGVTGGGSTVTQNAVFDHAGNITSLSTGGAAVSKDTTLGTNRLNAATYDSMGSMTSWNGNYYTYDKLGMAWKVTASGVDYYHVYTADDERVWTYQPGAPSRWTLRDLDGKVLREFKNNAGSWSFERDYVYRGSTPLAAITPSETHHLHPDHLGSPRLITGPLGAYRAYHAYLPFGSEATAFNQDTERMKFTGHERDLGIATSVADDLDYMHARFYNPQNGRFNSFDPIGGNPRVPQSWNRYSYVLGNPMKFIDPTGMYTAGFSSSNYVLSGQFMDEITVISSFYSGNSGATTVNAGMSNPHADFKNFLYGNHAGGRNFGASRDGRSEGWGLLDVANARAFYERRSDASTSVAGIFFNEVMLDVLPATQGELGVELAMAAIPGPLDNAAYSGLKGLKITGYTKHGLQQAMTKDGVGVSPKAILDAVKNPLQKLSQSGGRTKIVGKNATVVLNSDGKVITTWATSSQGWRIH